MADNTFVKQYQDGTTLTEAMLDTSAKSLKPDLTNLDLATTGSSDKQVLRSNGSGVDPSWSTATDLFNADGATAIRNAGLVTSVSSGALIVSLTTQAGTSPTASDSVEIAFSEAGTTNAQYTLEEITSSLSIEITASATIGATGTTATSVYIYAVRSAAGTVTLAVSANSSFDRGTGKGTAGMSAAADAVNILYASAALGTVVPRLLGRVLAAQNASGNWQTPTETSVSDKVDIGNPADANAVINAYTRTSGTAAQGVRGVAISQSSGSFNTTSTSFVSVSNLSVTITTSGRPLVVKLVGDNSASNSSIGVIEGSSGEDGLAGGSIRIQRDASTLDDFSIQIQGQDRTSSGALSTSAPPGSVETIDAVAAGTYTYNVQAVWSSFADPSNLILVSNCKLVAYEL